MAGHLSNPDYAWAFPCSHKAKRRNKIVWGGVPKDFYNDYQSLNFWKNSSIEIALWLSVKMFRRRWMINGLNCDFICGTDKNGKNITLGL